MYFAVRGVSLMNESAMDVPHVFDAQLYGAVRILLPVDVFWDEACTERIEEVAAIAPHVSVAVFGVRVPRGGAGASAGAGTGASRHSVDRASTATAKTGSGLAVGSGGSKSVRSTRK